MPAGELGSSGIVGAMSWTAKHQPTTKTITIGQKSTEIEVSFWPKKKSIFDDAIGSRNPRYFERNLAVVGGELFAVSNYELRTLVWRGGAWMDLVDEKRGKAAFDGYIDVVASDGRRAWAIARKGNVFEWNGESWTALGGGGPEFAKDRYFTRAAWDSTRERLVMWGGNNGNRASNDTLFFEKGAWRKSKKPGTKLSARKHDHYFLYDDTVRGGIVRVGAEAVSFLDGDAWVPLDLAPPKFVSAEGTVLESFFVAVHDPAAKRTRWLDPTRGDLYAEGGEKVGSIGVPVGMCSRPFLVDNGAYFSARDFDTENHHGWMFAWDPANHRAFGMCAGSADAVTSCEIL